MVIALSVWGTSVASTTLGTAGKLAIGLGGVSSPTTSKIGTATGYGELTALGTTAAWAAAGSIGAPTGLGWCLDPAELSLVGQTLIAGTWTPKIRLKAGSGAVTGDVYMRFYKRSSGGVYTLIGSLVASGVTLAVSFAAFSPAPSSLASMSFGTGDILYIDAWLNAATNAGGSAAVISVDLSSTTSGLASCVEAATPGYQVSGTQHTLDAKGRFSLKALKTRFAQGRFSLKAQRTRDAQGRFSLKVQKTRDAQGRFFLRAQRTRSGQGRFSLKAQRTRNAQGRFALSALGPGIFVFAGGTLIQILLADGITVDDKTNARSTASFTVIGTVASQLQEKMSILIWDNTNLKQLFAGSIDTIELNRLSPNNIWIWRVQCADGHGDTDRRVYTGTELDGFLAGDAVAFMHQQVLAAEGIKANYAMRVDRDQASFSQGTLTNVVAASDGTLQLASAGTTVAGETNTIAEWNSAASLSNIDVTNNSIQLASVSALKLEGTCGNNLGNPYVYQSIWAGTYVIASGDTLLYGVWINSNSPMMKAGIDGVCTDGTTLRDYPSHAVSSNLVDQNHLTLHADADLGGYANDQWYFRTFDLTPVAGKTLSQATAVFEGDNNGAYVAYFRDIVIMNGATTKLTIYKGASPHASILQPNQNARKSISGYAHVKLTPVIAYEQTGSRISTAISLTAAGVAKASSLDWDADVSADQGTLDVDTSLDGAVTWQQATARTALPGLMPGASLTGKTLTLRHTLNMTGKDPTSTPVVRSTSWSISPSYGATKSDTQVKFDTQANWNSGTVPSTITVDASGQIRLTGFSSDWNDEQITNQTLFGNAVTTFTQEISQRRLALRTDQGHDVRSRIDDAGQWADFVAQVDIKITGTGGSGFVYRTTGWLNGQDTFAYRVDMDETNIYLNRGTNGGASTRVQIGVVPLTSQVNDWHTLTVLAIGSSHKIYLDGWLALTVTDATYLGAGYLGPCYVNTSAARNSGFFDNFGVMAPTGMIGNGTAPEWIGTSAALGSIMVGDSRVFWDADQPSGATVNVLASVNGGAYSACTNGGVIPGLDAGVVLASGTLRLKVQMQSPSVVDIPVMRGLSAWVSSAFSSSGNRVSPALSLTPVGGRVGDTSLTWDADTQALTSLVAATSLDALSYTTIAAPGLPIAGIASQPDQAAEDFAVDNSSQWTNTSWVGGSPGIATWDTANSRLSYSGSSLPVYLWNVGGSAPSAFKHGTMTCVLVQADQVAFLMRWTDQNNHYRVEVRDSASGGTQQTISLVRRVAVATTTLVLNQPISFTRGHPHTLSWTINGSVHTVLWDGVAVITYTDASPYDVAGAVGFYLDFGAASPLLLQSIAVQPFGDDVTGKNAYGKLTLNSTDPTQTPVVRSAVLSARGPEIMDGAILAQTAYSYKSTAANIEDASKQSNFWWAIDQKNTLLFQNRAARLAPWPLWSGLRADGSCDMQFAPQPRVNFKSPQYRNRQYVNNAYQPQTFVDMKQGDGQASSWALSAKIISITSISVNGASRTFGVQGVDSGKDFYYTVGEASIAQDQNAIFLGKNEVATITFVGQAPYTAMREDNAQQALLASLHPGSTGIFENVEDGTGLDNVAADALAQARITQYAKLSRDWGFTTYRRGLTPGQSLSVFATEFNLWDADFLITGVKTSVERRSDGSFQFSYDVTCTEGPPLGSWARVFARAA